LAERLRGSLFFVPMLAVLGAAVLAPATLALDRWLTDQAVDLPIGLASTVESARAVLTTIAGATIAFAGVAFSVALLVAQRTATQFSPRVAQAVFRDPFDRRVIALVVGTFTYCVMVLRSVRSSIEAGGDPVIPDASVTLATVLGIAAILGTVAFINHSAHTMDISEVLARVRRQAVERIHAEWHLPGEDPAPDGDAPELPAPTAAVRFDRSGWVQDVDVDAMVRCVPSGETMRLETHAGRYAVEGTVLCTIPPALDGHEGLHDGVRSAVAIGTTRTLQQDVSYGLRQLADVALRALSPGVNDPTTAQDAIFHATDVLAELLRRDPPPATRRGEEGGWLIQAEQPDHADLVRLAFDETRRSAASQPAVCVYLLQALHLLDESLRADGLADRCGAVVEQADLVLAGARSADLLPADRRLVEEAYAVRFGARDGASPATATLPDGRSSATA
jgi:uncharacterized membrane protein